MIELAKSKVSSLFIGIFSSIAFGSAWVCVILIVCAPTFATADDQILVSAHLWAYQSLCELPEPAGHAKEARISGTIGQKGCRNLEEEWGTPVAVRIHLTNPGTSKDDFVINGLASLRLKKSTGTTVDALGFQWRLPGTFGGNSVVGIITEFKGSLAISVPPGQGVEFIVLFKDGLPGDSIIIGENQPVHVEKEKPQAASQPEVDKKPMPISDFKQRDQTPKTPSSSSHVASADRVASAEALRGVVKGISIFVGSTLDSKGNVRGAKKPDIFLFIQGDDGVLTRMRCTEATRFFDPKGKRLPSATVGSNVSQGDVVTVRTRLKNGELQAVEVHVQ